jgi:hypothetical protein
MTFSGSLLNMCNSIHLTYIENCQNTLRMQEVNVLSKNDLTIEQANNDRSTRILNMDFSWGDDM